MANFVVINSNAGVRIINTDLTLSVTRYDKDGIFNLDIIMVGKETFSFGFPNAETRDKYMNRILGISII